MCSNRRRTNISQEQTYHCSVCDQEVETKLKGLHNKNYHQIGTKKISTRNRKQKNDEILYEDGVNDNFDENPEHKPNRPKHPYLKKSIQIVKQTPDFLLWLIDSAYSLMTASMKTLLVVSVISAVVFIYNRLQAIKEYLWKIMEAILSYYFTARQELGSLFTIPSNTTTSLKEEVIQTPEKWAHDSTQEIRKCFDSFINDIQKFTANFQNPQTDTLNKFFREQILPLKLDFTERAIKQAKNIKTTIDIANLNDFVVTIEKTLNYCYQIIANQYEDGVMTAFDTLGNALQVCGIAKI